MFAWEDPYDYEPDEYCVDCGAVDAQAHELWCTAEVPAGPDPADDQVQRIPPRPAVAAAGEKMEVA